MSPYAQAKILRAIESREVYRLGEKCRIPNTPKPHDGRPWRRDARRWNVERRLAWLQNVRGILVRHAYPAENFLGFVQRGCTIILLRWY
jgi:transposase